VAHPYYAVMVACVSMQERPKTPGVDARMGGSGGNACMPESARDLVSEFDELAAELEPLKHKAETVEMMLVAKGLSMQQAGLIPMESDPKVLLQRIHEVDVESLRPTALMMGEIP